MFKQFLDVCGTVVPESSLFINKVKVVLGKNEDLIFNTIIKSPMRFNSGSVTAQVDIAFSSPNGTIAYGTIREFPSCCGKAIFHQLYITSITDEKEFSAANRFIIWKEMLTLAKRICSRAGYSSMNMIVSENEQPYIRDIMDLTTLRPVHVFENKRNRFFPHICRDYCIPVDEENVV